MIIVNHDRTPPPAAVTAMLSALALVAGATLFAAAPANAQQAQAIVTINATVLEVQCTAQQRLRIRACAPARESYSTENGKMLVVRKSATGEPAGAYPPQYDVRVDAGRQVMIRTVLY
jgi:hypothetical protein